MEHRDDEGQTPLMVAAANNQPGAIKCLIEVGKADIEARQGYRDWVKEKGGVDWVFVGPTALLVAINKGNLEAVKMLLEQHANIYAKDTDGYNSIQCAILYGSNEKERYTHSNFPSECGHLDIVKLLLKAS